jgi:hypothetical protein
MSPKARARNRGISAVFTAAIMALAVILIIAAIAVSWPMVKSTFDKNYWSGSMGYLQPQVHKLIIRICPERRWC